MSCCSVIGLMFLVITNLAIIIAFATPYWVEKPNETNQGLWAYCQRDSCTWVFEESYRKQFNDLRVDENWWIATQGLTSFGLALALFSLLTATIALCCDMRSCNASHTVSGILVFCFLTLAAASVVFGVGANKAAGVEIERDRYNGNQFGWSFWLNSGAAGMAFLTAVVYVIDGRGKTA